MASKLPPFREIATDHAMGSQEAEPEILKSSGGEARVARPAPDILEKPGKENRTRSNARKWTPGDLSKLSDEQLNELRDQSAQRLDSKSKAWNPVEYAKSFPAGKLSDLIKAESRARDGARKKLEKEMQEIGDKMRPQAEVSPHAIGLHTDTGAMLNTALRALAGINEEGDMVPNAMAKGAERDGHLAMAKASLRTLGKAPAEFWRSMKTTPLHAAFQAKDPELAALAAKTLGKDWMYAKDAKGKMPASFLGQTHEYAAALQALRQNGFDPGKLSAKDAESYKATKNNIIDSIGRRMFGKMPEYATLNTALRGLANAQESGSSSDTAAHTTMAKAALRKLGEKGNPSFWEYLDTNPRELAQKSGDPELAELTKKVFGDAWKPAAKRSKAG